MQDVSAIQKAKELAEERSETLKEIPDWFIQVHQMRNARGNAAP